MSNPNTVSSENAAKDLSTIIELSEEDTDLIAGGPQVENDPTDH